MPPGKTIGGYLNKKPFHPSTFENQEAVWKAEQKEQARLRIEYERMAKIREERYQEDLKILQVQKGEIPASQLHRLEWMYQTDLQDQNEAEEYLQGKSVNKLLTEREKQLTDNQGRFICTQFQESTTNGTCQKFALLNEDPLFQIMKEQEKSKKEIDYKLQQQDVLSMLREKLQKKKEKKEKKEKKKHKNKKRDRSSSQEHKEPKVKSKTQIMFDEKMKQYGNKNMEEIFKSNRKKYYPQQNAQIDKQEKLIRMQEDGKNHQNDMKKINYEEKAEKYKGNFIQELNKNVYMEREDKLNDLSNRISQNKKNFMKDDSEFV